MTGFKQDSHRSHEMEINLTAFQGPFDLLLHLIKKMEIDIYDIPVAEITDQYLEFIHQSSAIDLDQISDYLVMAATLIEIKSRLLIPIEDKSLDMELEEDPRKTLVDHLLLYQQFQEVADDLDRRQSNRALTFSRASSDLTAYQLSVPLEEGELELGDLQEAMLRLLQRQLDQQVPAKEIKYDQVSVSDKINAIRKKFRQLVQGQSLTLRDLMDKETRPEIIACFLAILELVRKQELIFEQKSQYGPIHIRG